MLFICSLKYTHLHVKISTCHVSHCTVGTTVIIVGEPETNYTLLYITVMHSWTKF